MTEATRYFAFNDETERFRRTVGEEAAEAREMESQGSAAPLSLGLHLRSLSRGADLRCPLQTRRRGGLHSGAGALGPPPPPPSSSVGNVLKLLHRRRIRRDGARGARLKRFKQPR